MDGYSTEKQWEHFSLAVPSIPLLCIVVPLMYLLSLWLPQDVISDTTFLIIILTFACVYFLALCRMINSEKRAIKTKFEGIVQSVTKMNRQINVLEQMITVVKDTNRREELFLQPAYVTKARRRKKRSSLSWGAIEIYIRTELKAKRSSVNEFWLN